MNKIVCIFVSSLFLCASSVYADVERVSVSSNGEQSNGSSNSNLAYGNTPDSLSISADGNFVVFQSTADNLVPDDTNARQDIFIHDVNTRVTERVSVSSNGTQGNKSSTNPSISADGRYVVFRSIANNLVGNDINNYPDIFIRDRQSGTTELARVSANSTQGYFPPVNAVISVDGRFIVFRSYARDIVDNDTNNEADVFIHDRQSGTTELVSISSGNMQGNSRSALPSISTDARFVAFLSSSTNLVDGDTNGLQDIFVRDRQSGTTERVSVSSNGIQGNHFMFSPPSISADGRFVAYTSYASNLVEGDSNDTRDIFVHDRKTRTTELVSVSSDSIQGNNASNYPSISADGRFIVFRSYASNLVDIDTNNKSDIFIHDRESGKTERASVSSSGMQGNSESRIAAISSDGRYLAFDSRASNLVDGDTNNEVDVFATENSLVNLNDDLTVTFDLTSGTTQVEYYIGVST